MELVRMFYALYARTVTLLIEFNLMHHDSGYITETVLWDTMLELCKDDMKMEVVRGCCATKF